MVAFVFLYVAASRIARELGRFWKFLDEAECYSSIVLYCTQGRGALGFGMAKNDPQMNLRIPVDLKELIEDAAKKNNRSLTAEVVTRLRETFERDVSILDLEWDAKMELFAERVAGKVIEKLAVKG